MIRLQLARMLAVSVSTGRTACCVTSQTWLSPCALEPGSSESWLGNAFSQIENTSTTAIARNCSGIE